MSSINLLPWREELRKTRNKIFAITCAIPTLAAAMIILLLHFLLAHLVAVKKADEVYLNQQLDLNKDLIKEVEGIDTKKKELLDRVSIIQSLQRTRVNLVRLLDALSRYTPDGIVLNKLSKSDKQITIVGIADSNNAISFMMRNLDKLDWVESTKLTDVREGSAENTSLKSGQLAFTVIMMEK